MVARCSAVSSRVQITRQSRVSRCPSTRCCIRSDLISRSSVGTASFTRGRVTRGEVGRTVSIWCARLIKSRCLHNRRRVKTQWLTTRFSGAGSEATITISLADWPATSTVDIQHAAVSSTVTFRTNTRAGPRRTRASRSASSCAICARVQIASWCVRRRPHARRPAAVSRFACGLLCGGAVRAGSGHLCGSSSTCYTGSSNQNSVPTAVTVDCAGCRFWVDHRRGMTYAHEQSHSSLLCSVECTVRTIAQHQRGSWQGTPIVGELKCIADHQCRLVRAVSRCRKRIPITDYFRTANRAAR
jgi:hypothetical protein